MAARTVIGGSGLVTLRQDNFAALQQTLLNPGQVVDGTNGNYIAGGAATATQDLRTVILAVRTTAALGTLTVRGCGNGVDINGNAQVSPYPSNAVFTQGAVGDLNVVTAAGTQTTYVGPLTTDRFLQPDGNVYLDWNGMSGASVTVLQMPFNIV